MEFDAKVLYPLALREELWIYNEIEKGYVFTPVMNNEIVKMFDTQLFRRSFVFFESDVL